MYCTLSSVDQVPGRGGEIALEVLPPLVMGSVVLKDPAAMLLDPVWLEQLLRLDPERDAYLFILHRTKGYNPKEVGTLRLSALLGLWRSLRGLPITLFSKESELLLSLESGWRGL